MNYHFLSWWFLFDVFPLPAQEVEAKSQNLTEDLEKKKQKKQKKISSNSITGFEEVFAQFATSDINYSDTIGGEVGDPLNPRQHDMAGDKTLVSQQPCALI